MKKAIENLNRLVFVNEKTLFFYGFLSYGFAV